MPDHQNQSNIKTFFKDEYQALKAYTKSRISDTADRDAEDIIQDVALRIFSRPVDALPINNIGGFVYSAIRNKIIDVLRTKKEHIDQENKIEQLWTEFSLLFYEERSDYPEHMKQKLIAAIKKLKPAYRDIILAVDFEGYTYREISEETGIAPGTLMSRRHRAIALLMEQLKKE